MRQHRRILHASDFSRASAAAFRHAMRLARDQRGELILVHVVPDVAPLAVPEIGAAASLEAYRSLQRAARREAHASLTSLVAAARKEGVPVHARVAEGVPHKAIVRVARREGADLIVMGTHGRTGLSRLLLGSVAARVIALAPCPVLTVRTGTGRQGRMPASEVRRRRVA